jgi:hypothetical protein
MHGSTATSGERSRRTREEIDAVRELRKDLNAHVPGRDLIDRTDEPVVEPMDRCRNARRVRIVHAALGAQGYR